MNTWAVMGLLAGLASTGCDDSMIAADADVADDGGGVVTGDCEERAATFQTLGSANPDLAEPMVSATCVDGTLVVTSNQIPDFPYIETSPGDPREQDLEFEIPSAPAMAAATTDVPLLGALGVAINGIPIFGPTEGAGGDVLALGGGFAECGGHNGPSGYHFHTFDVNGSDACRFSEAEASAGSVLFGYALDGYPIYSGNFQYTSSYQLTDESLFATDTWGAHTYVEGHGDLDQCNGRTDADGNYAYYTTDTFPYVLGCFRGEVTIEEPGGGGPPMP
ncbi:MAG: YHYH protein [Sandaracinaceae bacterium]